MQNTALRQAVERLLPRVTMPAQYLGGELNSVAKDHRQVRGRMVLAFPDTYSLGTSHHGLQVLYSIMNNDPQWACERAFAPWTDFEQAMLGAGLPLYGLETFNPLSSYDLVGFSLQYEVCYTNILTMLHLGGIPLHAKDRTLDHPLVIAGGPGAQNPEVLAPFIDLFVIGDGEESLPWVMDRWMSLKEKGGKSRLDMIAELAGSTTWAYAPACYEPDYHADGSLAAMNRIRSDVPREIMACTINCDFDDIPLPTKPIVSFVQTPHDRIAIEIMRGCPWQCRFCQSTVIKRPLRVRSVDTIIRAALETYRNTGLNEVSLLSLSTSDYPDFFELVEKMAEAFAPLGVSVSLPSLRVNSHFPALPKLMKGIRKAGMTLAPEVARDDMREQIRKPIRNDDLYDGCRSAFAEGWQKVKLYFLAGLPGERRVDLDGIVDMADRIAQISKEETGRYREVVASVSNFVPKPHT
ncbi:MAG: TIGR03960 family B12-binding radical SAM protein, partial [Gemmataceae bacterium]|nr:TIGR03960 family B12-binding radical SAM protein [Gemmataceae bacterium]